MDFMHPNVRYSYTCIPTFGGAKLLSETVLFDLLYMSVCVSACVMSECVSKPGVCIPV